MIRNFISVACIGLLLPLLGCEKKDYCAYNKASCESPDTVDMASDTGRECTTDIDCKIRQNATSQCSQSGDCIYTCNDGWIAPENPNSIETCVCDKSKSSCDTVSICGNGIIENDESCDNKELNSNTQPDACRLNCTPSFCGDGVKDSNESCDDGNSSNDDDCTTTCSKCGNGRLDEGETCDDGQFPAKNADGCSDSCQVEIQWNFRCSDELPSNCWQQLDPPEGSPGINPDGVAKNKDHLFISWQIKKHNEPGSIWIYEKNSDGVWLKSDELKDPENRIGESFSCKLYALDNELFCLNSPDNIQKNTSIYRFKKENNSYTHDTDNLAFIKSDIRHLSINNSYAAYTYKQNDYYYIATTRKENGIWGAASLGHTLPSDDLSKPYTLVDIHDNGNLLWSSIYCEVDGGFIYDSCTLISTIESPSYFMLIFNPNFMDTPYFKTLFFWEQGVFVSNRQEFWYLDGINQPILSGVSPNIDIPMDNIDMSSINNSIWLESSNPQRPFIQEAIFKNNYLSFGGKKYDLKQLPPDDILLRVRGTDEENIFLTETLNRYTSSPANGTIFILPR